MSGARVDVGCWFATGVTLARGRVLVSPSFLTTVAGMERLAVGWWVATSARTRVRVGAVASRACPSP